MSIRTILGTCIGAAALAASSGAQADEFQDGLSAIQRAYAAIQALPAAEQLTPYKTLTAEATEFREAFPKRAQALIWEAVVLTHHAWTLNTNDSRAMLNTARERLDEAEKVDPANVDWSGYSFMGITYALAPPWPLSFGDKDRARGYLAKAVSMQPNAIDTNFYLGRFLFNNKFYPEAVATFEKVLSGSSIAHSGPSLTGADGKEIWCNAMNCPEPADSAAKLQAEARRMLEAAKAK
jgi:tetratricopeptide (TPR) repeat protein